MSQCSQVELIASPPLYRYIVWGLALWPSSPWIDGRVGLREQLLIRRLNSLCFAKWRMHFPVHAAAKPYLHGVSDDAKNV
ncbi:hypothetical protein IAQ61_002626 [Plenodomus lingam]|uniref:Predicted protein n=1 Tax=Leptosphaeria maculans (strain JN3 / isolate v23.1.3 / race Av1-4-5-6-7-8) TaxID=985895 RepID=E4ZI28_LEPMJ|nr:predicted protein [Plenodomus lingam JN3]KAH9877262.1 hypothetical protein IAQ61_002626 [Plenodomus lingam]CBX91171.1 predicted protein [Plenodomus lingam JN3]